jgi:hypothetical protein
LKVLLVDVLSVMKIEHALGFQPSRATGIWIFQTKSLSPDLTFSYSSKKRLSMENLEPMVI